MITLRIRYRKNSHWIPLESDGKTIQEVCDECSQKLARNYEKWRAKQGNPIMKQALKRYEIGQKYMLIMKLEEKVKEVKK